MLKNLITDTELSFRSELQAKQSLIDQAQLKLRDLTTSLANERRNFSELEAKANSRKTLKSQIANLRRLNSEKRKHLASTGPPPQEDVAVGDADAGLTVDTSRMRPKSALQNFKASPLPERTSQQDIYLKSLESSHLLQARVRAYKAHNKISELRRHELNNRSSDLERKLRRIVALGTGVEEERVDETAGRLAAAIDSEEPGEMDMGRLREFLRQLEEVGE